MHVRLSIIGRVAVWTAGRRFDAGQVGSRKARTLLGRLAVERRRMVPVDLIVDALWGTAGPRQPAANVATLVSRLRATLGPEVIIGDRRGYRLAHQVTVDVHEAADLVTEAEAQLARAPRLTAFAALRAIDVLSRAPVLADEPGATWVERARVAQTELLLRAQRAIADARAAA